ncbi:hypothetical protein PWKp16_00077 [Klebsiella phage PWKp16]|nr:hypothetical protein PWKp16_00077 [Klebsiella phage PWKp16]
MKASDAVRLSVAFTERNTLIPNDVFEHIARRAINGAFSASFCPFADFGIVARRTEYEDQHYKMADIIRQFEELGYEVEVFYQGGNRYGPIDSIRVKW